MNRISLSASPSNSRMKRTLWRLLQRWIEKQLNESVSDLVRREHVREAAERLSTANAFGSLRALGAHRFQRDIRSRQCGRSGVAARSRRGLFR